jgi:5-formyltetrahydrofolate cyclo-ligase
MLVTLAGASRRMTRVPGEPGGRVMDRDVPKVPDAPGALDESAAPDREEAVLARDKGALARDKGALARAKGARDEPSALVREKAALRKRLLAARARLSPEQRAAAGRAIRDAVLALPEAQMAGTVAAYYSVATEPDTRGLVYALWKRGTYVLLPVLLADGDLDWASYEGPDSLRTGPRGLAEPAEPPRGVMGIASADLVLVPAVAVDRQGYRLGRGGGSYDRALTRVGGPVPTVALLYDGELLEEVPAGQHDQRVRLIARPSQGITRLPL